MARWRTPLILFGIGLLVFGFTAGKRLARQSTDPHFAYLADAWLHGRLDIEPPTKGDDWAKVETVRLKDGREARGRRLKTRRVFAIAGGGQIPLDQIEETVGQTHYVSFPPLPAVAMLPQAAVHGRIANDVATTVLAAALCLPLLFLVLRRAREAGLCQRSDREAVWLSIAMCFGTVFYFSAVQGRVWYTAHVFGVLLTLLYVLCALEARRPILAGLCLGLATLTRVPLAFLFPLFLFEAWRVCGGRQELRRFLITCAKFAAPVVLVAIVAMVHNYARFADPLEFGHGYLDVRQQDNIETFGKFNLRYLSRNLTVALALLPDIATTKPYVFINGHGLAIWFTTPLFFLLLWPRERGPLFRPLLVTAALVALPSLLYMNSGWIQFGYRFSLDYTPLLFLLLAVGARPLRRVGYVLIVLGILINLFGAATFPSRTYYDYGNYETVMKHAPLKKRLSK